MYPVGREADPLKGANSQRSQHSLLSAMIKAAPKVSDGPGPSEEVARAGAGTALLDAVAAGRRDVGRWSLDEGHAALKQIEASRARVQNLSPRVRRRPDACRHACVFAVLAASGATGARHLQGVPEGGRARVGGE